MWTPSSRCSSTRRNTRRRWAPGDREEQAHEEGHVAKDAVAKAELMEELEQPAAEKEKEVEGFARKVCSRQYTDASGSGGANTLELWVS
jgi:hypothetical protein